MKEETERDKLLRFLMGDLREEQRRETEERFLADNQFFEQLCALQDEIIDDYVRKRLSESERRLVREKLLSPACLAQESDWVRGLIALMARPSDGHTPFPRRLWQMTIRSLKSHSRKACKRIHKRHN